jgi:hypothetical protein
MTDRLSRVDVVFLTTFTYHDIHSVVDSIYNTMEEDMDESDGNIIDRKFSEIVRLRLDGAHNVVNTLRDQQTSRGISLVCPFPSLEVDLPVSFGASENADMQRGAIHRIGVEDDPDTGLPRLRLSIRTFEDRPVPTTEPEQPLKDVAANVIKGPSEREDHFCGQRAPALYKDDPAWVNCFEIPMPEELIERVKTRRRYKMISRVAWLVALTALVAGGYFLQRSGYVDIEKARSYVSGFSMDSFLSTPNSQRLASASASDLSLDDSPIEPDQKLQETSLPLASEMIFEDSKSTPDHPASAVESVKPETVIETAEQTQPLATSATSEIQAKTEINSGSIENSTSKKEDEVQLLLPTRWPVEYASGYRVRDPNGVVVDVPGGLVKREGWLDDIVDHPMVRSIKSIQRETGARFIVRINGELPRFMTTPKTGGVFLTLYYTEDSEAGPSEKVALAE